LKKLEISALASSPFQRAPSAISPKDMACFAHQKSEVLRLKFLRLFKFHRYIKLHLSLFIFACLLLTGCDGSGYSTTYIISDGVKQSIPNEEQPIEQAR
jgi:hypothetical protein